MILSKTFLQCPSQIKQSCSVLLNGDLKHISYVNHIFVSIWLLSRSGSRSARNSTWGWSRGKARVFSSDTIATQLFRSNFARYIAIICAVFLCGPVLSVLKYARRGQEEKYMRQNRKCRSTDSSLSWVQSAKLTSQQFPRPRRLILTAGERGSGLYEHLFLLSLLLFYYTLLLLSSDVKNVCWEAESEPVFAGTPSSHVSKTDFGLNGALVGGVLRSLECLFQIVLSVFRRLASDVAFKWSHTETPSGAGLTERHHLRQGQNNHHPDSHYPPLKSIPLKRTVFGDAREGDDRRGKSGEWREE